MTASKIEPGIYSISSVGFSTQDIDIGLNKINAVGWVATATTKQRWIIKLNDLQGGYTITNVRTEQFLTVEGGDVVSVSPGQRSRWNIVDEGQDQFKIELIGDGRAAALTSDANDAPILLRNYTGKKEELWRFQRRSNLE